MGLLSSRNGSSQGWFTLQDEPVHDVTGDGGWSDPRPTRGRGLVKLVDTPAPVTISKEACFTRPSPLQRCSARVANVLSATGASRFGALALSAAVVILAVAVMGLLSSRGGSDHAMIQAYKMQVARLATERDRALGAAAQAGQANAAAQTQLERWRSLAIAEQRAARVRRLRARHNHRRGGSR